jgi:hypothetical protein
LGKEVGDEGLQGQKKHANGKNPPAKGPLIQDYSYNADSKRKKTSGKWHGHIKEHTVTNPDSDPMDTQVQSVDGLNSAMTSVPSMGELFHSVAGMPVYTWIF